MNQFLRTTLLISGLLWVVFLAGCQRDDTIQGEIMLWHSWSEADTAVLSQIVTNYETINPGATVLVQRLEPNQIVDRYISSVANGLGPDLIILPSTAIMSLAEQGAIDPIDTEATAVVQERYFRAALDSMRYENDLYGLPLALEPMVMFYNPQTVTEPATTLDMLLAQAEAGNEVALNTSFEGLFWGIQAFGGQVLREDGMVNINSGGVANWLRWLQRAQSTPGMILSRDNDALTDLFIEGTADYFAAPITRYNALVAQMGEENVAIMPLPSGPSGSSGPLLHVEGVLFNPYSSPNQRELALNLAQFLTNTEQSRGLMRQTGRAPANRNVQVLATAYPMVTAVISQARTAVPTGYKRTLAELYPLGDRVLAEMLQGSLDPNQALVQLAEGAGENAVITAVPESTSQACTQSGKLVISHGWRGSAEEWLQTQIQRYMAECPGTLITLNRINTNALLALYQAQVVAETAPELLLGPDQWLRTLAEGNQIAPMPAPQNDPDLWQRFSPVAQQSISYRDTYFAIPLALELHTLFYNDEWVVDPPQQVDDLVSGATAANPIALPLDFQALYWGLDAFGGSPLQADGSFVLDESGLVPWLSWLATYREDSRFLFYEPEVGGAASQGFVAGEVAMNVASSAQSMALAEVLGANLGVQNLPAGPVAPARPWATSQVLYFRAELSSDTALLARDFAAFMTEVEAQEQLFLNTSLIPTNIKVTAEQEPRWSALLEQVNTAVVPPRTPEMASFAELGGQMYHEVILDGRAPQEVACELAERMNSRHNHDVRLPAECR